MRSQSADAHAAAAAAAAAAASNSGASASHAVGSASKKKSSSHIQTPSHAADLLSSVMCSMVERVKSDVEVDAEAAALMIQYLQSPPPPSSPSSSAWWKLQDITTGTMGSSYLRAAPWTFTCSGGGSSSSGNSSIVPLFTCVSDTSFPTTVCL